MDGALDHGRPIAKSKYQEEFRKSVLSVLDRKSSQFASIAQSVIAGSLSKAASNSGHSGVSFGVSMGSAAYSSARGIREIQDLKSYVIAGVGSSASDVESHLPSFAGILQERSRVSPEAAASR